MKEPDISTSRRSEDYIAGVLQEVLALAGSPRVGAATHRRYSILFEFQADGQAYVLKIRKKRRHTIADLDAILASEQARKANRNEWAALTYFHEATRGPDCPIDFVEPVAFAEALNGIVTGKVEGIDLWRLLRRPRLACGSAERGIARRLGQGLAVLHKATEYGEESITKRVERCPTVGREWFDRPVADALTAASTRVAPVVRGMEGLDARDVVIARDGRIVFLDPSTVKRVFSYQSIAGFVTTLRNISRDSMVFPRRRIVDILEDEFITAYRERAGIDAELYPVFRLLHLAYSFKRSLRKVRKRRLPLTGGRHLVSYVERYYRRELDRVLQGVAHG